MEILRLYYNGALHTIKPNDDELFYIVLYPFELDITYVKKCELLYHSNLHSKSYDINNDFEISVEYYHDNFVIENDQYMKIVVELYELLKSQIFTEEEVCEIMNIISKYLGDLYEQYQCFYESLN